MRKTSKYAQKLKRIGNTYNAAEYLNVIQRCRPYTNEPIPGSWLEGTQSAATKAMLRVRESYVAFKDGKATGEDFDVIAHALGVAWIRAIDIAGVDAFTNTMLPIITTANEAMERSRTRFKKFGKWGFDGPAIDAVDYGIEVYETIISSSSPAQMTQAADRRNDIVEQKLRLAA